MQSIIVTTTMRIFLTTLGCRLNEAELESWSRGFHAKGIQLTANPDQASLVVVNTCAVTEEAVRKSRKLIRRVRRDNPHAKLVVSGCYSTLQPDLALNGDGIDLIVSNARKDQLPDIVSKAFGGSDHSDLVAENTLFPEPVRQRAFLKVQDGCRHRCTYCIVTVARGQERSRPIAEVVREINQLQREGLNEVVLAGIHLGGYGSDIDCDLAGLIGAVLHETDIPRLRIGSVEPWDLRDDFWSLFGDQRLLPHLHLPLQSGSDTVLRRMARRTMSAEYAALVARARRQVSDINITTDIMVGFPGESDEEWQQTLEFVQRQGFGGLHVFSFSPRPGTHAAALKPSVAPAVKRRRSQELRLIGAGLSAQYLKRFSGRVMPVLVEEYRQSTAGESGGWRGYTPNYLRVVVDESPAAHLKNQIVDVALGAVTSNGDTLCGSIANESGNEKG